VDCRPEKGATGDVADNWEGSDGDLGSGLPPPGQFFLFQLFLEHRLLDRNPFAPFHVLSGSNDLHLAFIRQKAKLGSAVFADGLHFAQRQGRRRRAVWTVIDDHFCHRFVLYLFFGPDRNQMHTTKEWRLFVREVGRQPTNFTNEDPDVLMLSAVWVTNGAIGPLASWRCMGENLPRRRGMKNKGRIVVVLVVMVVAILVVSALAFRGRLRRVDGSYSGVSAEDLPPRATPENVRVALWNVRNFPLDRRPQDPDLGYSRRTNIADLEDALRGVDADVIGFEEITDPHGFSDLLKGAGGTREYQIRFGSRGGPHGQKVGLAWDDARIEMIGAPEEIPGVALTDRYKPALVVAFRFRQDPAVEFTVIQVHLAASPRGYSYRRQQYQALADWINANAMGMQRSNLVVQGDFNVTGWEGGSYAEERDLLDSLMQGAGMRRLPNATGCSEYWEGGGRWDGVQVPAMLDLVYVKGFQDRQLTSPRSWLHCKRAGCAELISIAGKEDATFWDVSDHCPVTYEIH